MAQPGESDNKDHTHTYYQGRLMDISAGGAQIVIPIAVRHPVADCTGLGQSIARREASPSGVRHPLADPDEADFDFRKGQFIGLRFTPLPYETPLMFNAQIRNILPTADHTALCLGLQIVGLEASAEGRQTLARIAAVVDTYHRINDAAKKRRDINYAPTTGGSGLEVQDLAQQA
jgi:hypothetical protein